MLESSLIYILVRSLPESIIILASFIILLNIKIDLNKFIRISVISWIFASLLRVLPISFGVHTILIMCIYMIMINKISNNRPIKIVIAACEVFIALALSEGIYIAIVTALLSIPSERLFDNTQFESAILTLPSLLILILIVILFKKIQVYIKKG